MRLKNISILLSLIIVSSLLNAAQNSPQNLAATPGNQQVMLRWNQNTESDLHKYKIYRDTSSPATTLIDSCVALSPPDTFYIDTELSTGQIYYYRVTALDSAGNESGFSDEVSASTTENYGNFDWCTVPAGDYTWGSNDQTQTIYYEYQIMKYEVTNEQYVEYLEEALSAGDITVSSGNVEGYYEGDENWSAGNYEYLDLDDSDCRINYSSGNFSIESGYENHPVVEVTWFGANAFAKNYGYLLPTEEEWEKAARGNTGYDYPWGNNIDGSRVNYWNSGDPWDNGTTLIGFYNGQNYSGFQTTDSPSPYGAYDMSGNVWEWTNSFYYSTNLRVIRGGSWDIDPPLRPYALKSWFCCDHPQPGSEYDLAFRCIRTHSADFGSNTTYGNPPLLVNFIDQSFSDNPITSLYWDFGDGETSTIQNPVHVYEEIGTYSVSLTVNDGTDEYTITKVDYITVVPFDLQEGLVAYYPFNGNANDESGNGNHGTVYGSTLTEDRFENTESAYEFDGVYDYILVQDSPELQFGTSDFTIAFWFMPVLLPSWQSKIIHKTDVDKGIQIIMLGSEYGINSREVLFDWGYDSELWSAYRFEMDIWHHFLVERIGDNVRIYSNGSNMVERTVFPINDISPTGDLIIGKRGGDVNYFGGKIDDVRIYNRALTESEIQELYNEVSPSAPKNLSATPSNQQVTLRWNKNTESNIHKYNIYRDTSSPASTLIDSVVGSPPDTFHINIGLTNGQIYYYRITAVGNAGNESEYSDEVSAIPNPVTIHVSTSGNDSNSGTASNPLRNIQTALSRANSGDTIKVAEGTYEEGLIPQNSVVLYGGYTGNFSESERHRFNHKTIVQAVSATILTDNKGCTVDGFVFDGNGVCDLGIKLTDGSVFTHNLVWRVNAFAAHSMKTYGGAVVVNNTIVESGYGLDIYSGSGTPVFKNNIIAHTNFGVNTIGYSSAVRSYNNVYGNTYNYIGFDDTPGIGDISLNPQFVDRDNGDFRLREDSPCIDRGDPDAQYNDPDGSRNDIGVYNYFGGPPSAPTGLTATPGPAAAGQVTLRWDKNTESDLHKYNIYRDTSSPAITLIDSCVASSPPDTFYVDMAVMNDITYYYRITAVDIVGNESDFSNEVVTTPPNNCLADSPWPKFHGNSKNTGQSPYVGPQTNRLKWSYQTGSHIRSSPAIGNDGVVYVGSLDNKLYAVNPDGSLKWSYLTGYNVSSSPAIGSDGTIYVGSSDYKLYAINPDGSLKWSYQTGGSIYLSSPAIGSDGVVYVGSLDNKLYALNPDGTLKWSYQTGGAISSSPAIGSDGTVYVGSSDYKLYAVNPDGTLNWSYQTGDVIYSSPAIGNDGTVYVGSNDKKLYALNPDGSLKWSYQTGGYIYSSPAIGSDGTVYVGSFDFKLYAVNPDGTLKWSYQTGERIFYISPAIGSDGTVYVGSHDNKIYAVNPDGTLKWSYQTGGGISSSPAIGNDGTVYVGSSDYKLYAFQDLDEEDPTMALKTPSGGEVWNCESDHEVKWEASDDIIVSNIALYYSIDNGINYIAIDTTEVNDSSYTWTLPNTPSNECKLKIIARDGVGNTATDISDGTFTIADSTKPTVQVISPNGGEMLGIGLTDTIRFSISDNVGVSYYKIFFSSNNGISYKLIDSLSSIQNSYIWNVPILFSNECLVKIIVADSSGNIGEDISNSTFEITDLTVPDVALLTPTGGEEFVGALEYTIGWTASDNYKLALAYFYFSSDNGKTFSIFDSTNAQDFTYDWIAPDIHSDSCRLRIVVKDSIGNSASDSTKEVFKIGRGPTAFLTTPTTEQSGDIIIEYQLWDKQRDALSFTSYYSIDSGENWLKANVVGDTSNIDSLSYDGFITWKSGIDIPHVDKSTIQFKIFVSDTAIGMSGQTGDFHVDNNNVPVVDTLFTPTAEETGDIELHFIVADAENDTLNYCMQYSMDSGHHWEEPSISFDYYNMPAPEDTLSLTWHSDNDISNLDLNTVMFKVIPMDNDTGIFGQTGVFHVDNETGPLVVNRQPEIFGLWQDTIIIHFDRSIDTNSIVNNYEITSTKSGLITVNRSFSENHHSLFIVAVQPFVNDIVTVKLYGTIQDAFGNGLDGDADGDPEGSPTDDYSWSFTIPYLGDYNADEQVEIQDLIIFAEAWQNDPQDLSKEIGPVAGDLPEFQLTPDNIIDFEDFVTLARMWNYTVGLSKISTLFAENPDENNLAGAQQNIENTRSLAKIPTITEETRPVITLKYQSVKNKEPYIPMIYLNPIISQDPWNNSQNGSFEVEIKTDQYMQLKGSQIIFKYNKDLLRFDGFREHTEQSESMTKSLSKSLDSQELNNITGISMYSDKLILQHEDESTVLLDIVQMFGESEFVDENDNILILQFSAVKAGVSDIKYFYSAYGDEAELLDDGYESVQIDSKLLIPESFAIYQNYPNPFNSNTIIKYQIPFEGKTTINIYDIMGRLVNTLVDERQMPGYYLSRWDGRNNSGQIVSSGMYIYQIISLSEKKDFVKAKKLLLLK